ncbi:MAG: Carboxypeptidase Taq [Verrucomicrobiales bacterium]|nr:Carboxypeptidase Taq [Verrucomicrobiales bacterium]
MRFPLSVYSVRKRSQFAPTAFRVSQKNMTLNSYTQLLDRMREIGWIDGAAGLLSWDQETYMPAAAIEFRAAQLAYFKGRTHRLFTADEVGGWIKECESAAFSSLSKEAVNVREWRRAYDRATKLSPELVEEFERSTSMAWSAWIAARKGNDFAVFKPHLAKLLDLSRQMAEAWGYAKLPYDALLDGYEPGARTDELQKVFAELKPGIVRLIEKIGPSARSASKSTLPGPFPIEAQKLFNQAVAERIGFDFTSGRIDIAAHPFCTGIGPSDCRLTTRYDDNDFTDSLYSVLHECGHGLYDQGLPKEDFGTPMGSAVSLGIHESQSRLWENHVGRSREFWNYWLPVAQKHFPTLATNTAEDLYRHVNQVRPSLIRVEADEVTYDLHIILRFELEQKLLHRELSVEDLPEAWNTTFKRLFGLEVPDDTRGCLQDIHWSHGSFGYFPTYTLGNLNASQLIQNVRNENPNLNAELAQGDYGSLLRSLRHKIHQHGHRYLPPELMKEATGESTQGRYHAAYLERKFGS